MTWQDQAVCKGHTSSLFSGDRHVQALAVAELCTRCPVIAECADAGVDEDFGVWGGYTQWDRPKQPKEAHFFCARCKRNRVKFWNAYCSEACRHEARRETWRKYNARAYEKRKQNA